MGVLQLEVSFIDPLIWVMEFHYLQQYFSYILMGSFLVGENRNTVVVVPGENHRPVTNPPLPPSIHPYIHFMILNFAY